jgi:hypothetical protein
MSRVSDWQDKSVQVLAEPSLGLFSTEPTWPGFYLYAELSQRCDSNER